MSAITNGGLSLLAGALSTLSPCVLPIVPLLLGAAVSAHRRGPLALAAGLALSYAVIGTTIASAGTVLGFDPAVLRSGGAVLLGVLGLLLVSPSLQQRFASVTAGAGSAGHALMGKVSGQGWSGQFAIGLLLGVVWSPCVGPTLGAAIVLASQGTRLPEVAATMALFGLGAALPVLLLGQLSRSAAGSVKARLLLTGKVGKAVMGVSMLLVAALILSGLDKPLETAMIAHLPGWLSEASTRY